MPKLGRRKGRRSKGYFYRKGRGWGTSINQRFIPLTHPDGSFIRERNTEDAVLREAFERWKLARAEAARQAEDQPDAPTVTITEVCNFYLRYAQAEGAASTYQTRADALFDFCYALPARFRRVMEADKAPTAALRKEMEAARCKHPPFGKLSWNELLPLHLAQWTQAHPGWKGSKKTLLQAVKRALNYAVEMKLIPLNPIKGYKIPRNKPRVTYITPEQEAAMLAEANPALRMAIRICIRTGARYFSEFARITAKHVKDDGERMEWVLQPHEAKNKKLRVIRITDPEILEIVRRQVAKHPKGPIFRGMNGKPWQANNFRRRFVELRHRLEAKGMEFDADCCMYSCRHTYAKRTLQGYWSGKPTNIETLAKLMGNTPQVCREHYLQWCESYNEVLWENC